MQFSPRTWMRHYNIYKDVANKTITVFADIFIYGSKASETLANDIAKDVHEKWNAPYAKIYVDGKEYAVGFSIGGYYTSSPQNRITDITDHKKIFIEIEEKNDSEMKQIFCMDKVGTNTNGVHRGYWGFANVGYKSSFTNKTLYTRQRELQFCWVGFLPFMDM